ncbi:MAG: zf-HC2 domain-containing protein [Tissierellia bacterium]|nr:zf-HC2 domain-containing protein [Tissierellia bacterium]
MEKNKCKIVQDLLPLYVDGVVHEKTKEFIEKHLKECNDCKQLLKDMTEEVQLPLEQEDSFLKHFKKKMRFKKIFLSGISILLTTCLFLGIFYYIFHWDTTIPYNQNLIKIEVRDDSLISHFYGSSYYKFSAAGPFQVEINGRTKNIMFLNYSKTISDSPDGKLFNRKKSGEAVDSYFPLEKIDKVDAIYYTDYKVSKEILNDEYKKKLMEHGKLIWTKIS